MPLLVENLCVRYQQQHQGQGQGSVSGRTFWRWPWSRGNANELAPVLDQLNLTVNENDFLVILGPSGSGKSTLLRSIAGLIRPNAGRITLGGKDITQCFPHQRDISMVFQNGGWYDHLTVQQHFEFDSRSDEVIHRVLKQLDLEVKRHHKPAELSGGQAQRLAIGRALVRDRSLLLLDEPLSQLDSLTRDSLRQLLKRLHSENRTFVYVTHDQQDAMILATKMAVLHQGKIQQIGLPNELYDLPNHRCVAEVIGQPSMQFFNVDLSSRIDVLKSYATSIDGLAKTVTMVEIERAIMNRNSNDLSNVKQHIGIRPAAWKISNTTDTSEEQRMPFQVSFVGKLVDQRFFGQTNLLEFVVKDCAMPNIQAVEVRSVANPNRKMGECYRLNVSCKELHCFDAETGARIS